MATVAGRAARAAKLAVTVAAVVPADARAEMVAAVARAAAVVVRAVARAAAPAGRWSRV